MDKNTISTSINKLCQYISKHQLSDFFNYLNEIVDNQKHLVFLNDKIRKQAEIYDNLLKYSFTGVKDPERNKIYSKLKLSLFEIVDDLKVGLIRGNMYLAINSLHQESNYEYVANRQNIESKLLKNKPGKEADVLFRYLMSCGKLTEEDIELLNRLLKSKTILWTTESLIVSALTISNLMFFDEKKLDIIIRYYQKGNPKVWQRALVGLVFNIYTYSERLPAYQYLIQKMDEIKEDHDFNKNLQYVILQIIRTKETQKISRKLHDEIIPEVAKMKPKIEEKLKLDDILKESLGEDKNPDWEAVFEDSPELFSKLEEFSKLQIEGSDVFMSAFALLKHFDFFREPSHWFLPFYKENPDVMDAFEYEKPGFNSGLFLEGLEKSAFLCNSDKYSFIMNVRFLPETQKNMMLEMFNAELESMSELVKDEEIVNKTMMDKYIINQYIQDLYRFYKLYPNRTDFEDVFDDKLDIHNASLLNTNWFDFELFKSIGSLYFKKEYFTDALEVYKALINKGLNEQKAYEKIAYSYQKLGDYDEALRFYKKSELFETNLIWTTKKIALCYRETGKNQEALEYYLKAEANEPENLYVQAHIGHTYLRLKDYENALKHYYKVEYFSPSNNMILRPIAWCSFVLGKFENSIKYYQKLIEKSEANYYDFLNLGHAYWCVNKMDKAVESYRKSIALTRDSGNSIKKEFSDDKEFLIKHGIQAFEIELMLDYLFFNFNF